MVADSISPGITKVKVDNVIVNVSGLLDIGKGKVLNIIFQFLLDP